MKKAFLIRLINFWPPYFGAGIRVSYISPDFRVIDVKMKLRFWNRNYVGTHFGGSLYSMVDPFFMLMLLENLGKDFIVWDKSASIRFKKPGKGIVFARFELSVEEIERIKSEAEKNEKVEPLFKVLIKDETGDVVSEVEKLLYVKKKVRPKIN
jgi:hypothetical protein